MYSSTSNVHETRTARTSAYTTVIDHFELQALLHAEIRAELDAIASNASTPERRSEIASLLAESAMNRCYNSYVR